MVLASSLEFEIPAAKFSVQASRCKRLHRRHRLRARSEIVALPGQIRLQLHVQSRVCDAVYLDRVRDYSGRSGGPQTTRLAHFSGTNPFAKVDPLRLRSPA